MIHGSIPGISSSIVELSVSVLYLPLSYMWLLTTENRPSLTLENTVLTLFKVLILLNLGTHM